MIPLAIRWDSIVALPVFICNSLAQLLFNIVIVGEPCTSHFHEFSLFFFTLAVQGNGFSRARTHLHTYVRVLLLMYDIIIFTGSSHYSPDDRHGCLGLYYYYVYIYSGYLSSTPPIQDFPLWGYHTRTHTHNVPLSHAPWFSSPSSSSWSVPAPSAIREFSVWISTAKSHFPPNLHTLIDAEHCCAAYYDKLETLTA